ncbi:MAG: hypothetical protein HYV54_00105 [Parcubacteria group bacterium]|nr:hypothetical protein [Parcubacteria group bacterium]
MQHQKLVAGMATQLRWSEDQANDGMSDILMVDISTGALVGRMVNARS